MYKLIAIFLYIIFLRRRFIATQLLKIIFIFINILFIIERKILVNYYYNLYIFVAIIRELSNFTNILFNLFTNIFLETCVLIEIYLLLK